jgi:hypothetical protein
MTFPRVSKQILGHILWFHFMDEEAKVWKEVIVEMNPGPLLAKASQS